MIKKKFPTGRVHSKKQALVVKNQHIFMSDPIWENSIDSVFVKHSLYFIITLYRINVFISRNVINLNKQVLRDFFSRFYKNGYSSGYSK